MALDKLAYLGLNGPVLQATKQLQISTAQDWYSNGTFNVEGSLAQMAALPVLAFELGYASVRGAGGPGKFLSEAHRRAFMRYERLATNVLAHLPFVGLGCYASAECLATDMFDIMSAHPRALLRTQAGWTSI